jgi:uncharacterized protein (TIGR02611 family)
MTGQSPIREVDESRPPVQTSTPPPAAGRARWLDIVRTTYRVIRANPTGRIALKVTVGLLGAAVVAVGIALIPLPGPGWAIVILGLSIWAIEFVWARHLLRFTRSGLTRWLHWVGRQPWAVRLMIAAAGLLFVSIVIWLSLKYSFGIDLWARLFGYVTTH